MKNIILALSLLLVVNVVGFSHPTSADAATKKQIQCGVNAAANLDCTKTPSSTSIGDIIKTVINILSAFAGAAAVIMLIVGGFRYVTSAGSEKGVESAKKTILYALIGLVIVSVAQIIVHYVLNSVP